MALDEKLYQSHQGSSQFPLRGGGGIYVSTKCHGKTSNSYQDISLKTKNVNLIVALHNLFILFNFFSNSWGSTQV